MCARVRDKRPGIRAGNGEPIRKAQNLTIVLINAILTNTINMIDKVINILRTYYYIKPDILALTVTGWRAAKHSREGG